jgi:hypothetical protein
MIIPAADPITEFPRHYGYASEVDIQIRKKPRLELGGPAGAKFAFVMPALMSRRS